MQKEPHQLSDFRFLCRAPGQERFTRLKTLGVDYTEEAIKERIAGKRTKAAKAPKEQRGVSLLIDIENSIKAQESRGYEQWAKIHNLKLAAKTMNFLTEHKIEQYADLVSRIEEINAENEKTPLSFDGAISSLSAIILDDGYYEFIRDNATNIGGITLLDALHIIPLKMRAHIDINRSYEEGRHCNDKDRRKHRSDIVRLAGLLPPSARLELIEQMRADAGDFFTDFASYVNRQTNRKERARLQDTLSFLEKVYL